MDLNYNIGSGGVFVNSERYVFLRVDNTTWCICQDTGRAQIDYMGIARQFAIGHDASLRLMQEQGKDIGPRTKQEYLFQAAAKLAHAGHVQAAIKVFRLARNG